MKVLPTELSDVVVIEPNVFRDERGFFLETYHERKYRQAGIPPAPAAFVQDNHSCSIQATLRGLHAQRHHPQGKLVRVMQGEIFDVAVDIRRGSPTFKRWVGVTISAQDFRQIYLPPGFAHGFCVLSKIAEVEYKCTDFYDPSDEFGIAWNDPEIGIVWPVQEPILSDKDQKAPSLAEVVELLPVDKS